MRFRLLPWRSVRLEGLCSLTRGSASLAVVASPHEGEGWLLNKRKKEGCSAFPASSVPSSALSGVAIDEDDRTDRRATISFYDDKIDYSNVIPLECVSAVVDLLVLSTAWPHWSCIRSFNNRSIASWSSIFAAGEMTAASSLRSSSSIVSKVDAVSRDVHFVQ